MVFDEFDLVISMCCHFQNGHNSVIVLHKETQKIDLKLNDGSALSIQKQAQLNHRQAALVAQLQSVLAQL